MRCDPTHRKMKLATIASIMSRKSRLKLSSLALLLLLSTSSVARSQGFSQHQADSYITSHNWDAALKYATAWTKAEPNNYHPWGALGVAYGMGFHQPANAISAFKKAVELNPDFFQCWNAMGVEYLNLKNYAEAVMAFQHATKLAPTRWKYWNNLVVAYSERNQRDPALAALHSAEQSAFANATAVDWYNLGNAYNQLMDYENAVRVYKRSLHLNPRDGKAWTNLGCAQQSLGHWEDALQDYKRGSDLGDALGRQNLANLQAGIAEEKRRQQAAAHPSIAAGDPYHSYDIQRREWNAQHPGQYWGSGFGSPPSY
jgi:tetratricopeptide (TPR) repeat protein